MFTTLKNVTISQAEWNALTGDTAADVDIITHSTGGLVSRAYVQSDIYGIDGFRI